jgi:hypothetical protein
MESRTIRYGVIAYAALLLTFGGNACSKEPEAPAHDPGVRGGAAGAGNPHPGLSDQLQKLFDAGLAEFVKLDQVKDDGLGPRMNLNSCLGCHANPAPGGSSPESNPQFSFFKDSLDHNTNVLPSFITENGPTREARFKFFDSPNNTVRDGGAHDLFTIAGMKDAEGCKIEQPKFEMELRRNNAIFRIPTPVFGAGLIERQL